MFGNPAFGALSQQETVTRGQLLRPFPQFKNIFAHQVSAGYARYDSMVLKFEKRIVHCSSFICHLSSPAAAVDQCPMNIGRFPGNGK
jgi:hypothetical protein